MKITIGHTKKYYLDAFKKQDINVSDWAKDLIDKIEFSGKKKTLEVEIVTVGDLGLGYSRLKTVYQVAKEKGYDLLPAEAGLAFRLAYKEKGWITVGMEPITDSDGYLNVFAVMHHDDGRWLASDCSLPDDVWDADFRFVFYKSSALKSDSSLPLEKRILELEKFREKVENILKLE